MATEMRLIDANRLRESVMTDYYEHYTQCHTTDQIALMDMVEYCIEEQPTVDAVEVVRCRDCKRYDNSEGICWCKLNSRFFPGGLDWHGFPEDGFCSYGERKDDG